MITNNCPMVNLSEEFKNNFKRKKLNSLDKYALECALQDFIDEYETVHYGETYTNIRQYTRYNEDCVDILDGIRDTYFFDEFAINSIWCTENGIIMLSCYLANEDETIDYDSDILFRLN